MADAVHAVVPVAAAHERQAVRADRPAGLERADAVLVDGGGLLGDGRAAGRRPRASIGSSGPSRKAVTLVEHGRVAGRREVLGDHERQPVAVVGDVRAHAAAGERLPPVQHVALGELVARRLDDLLAHEVGAGDQQREARPAAGRGSRTRPTTGRSPCGPRGGTRAPGRAAGRSPSGRAARRASSTCDRAEQRRPRTPRAARARRRPRPARGSARRARGLLERGGLAEQEARPRPTRPARASTDGHQRAAVVVEAAGDAAERLAAHRRRVARARRCGRRTRCGSPSRSAAAGRRRGTRSGRGSRG